jgi:hypothetical protein
MYVEFLCQLLRRKTLNSFLKFVNVKTKETREGWPLLTVETEVNGDSRRTNERAISRLVDWACRAGTRDFCSALATLVGPV